MPVLLLSRISQAPLHYSQTLLINGGVTTAGKLMQLPTEGRQPPGLSF